MTEDKLIYQFFLATGVGVTLLSIEVFWYYYFNFWTFWPSAIFTIALIVAFWGIIMIYQEALDVDG